MPSRFDIAGAIKIYIYMVISNERAKPQFLRK